MTNNAETGKLFGGVILKMLELVKMGASFVGVPFCVEIDEKRKNTCLSLRDTI